MTEQHLIGERGTFGRPNTGSSGAQGLFARGDDHGGVLNKALAKKIAAAKQFHVHKELVESLKDREFQAKEGATLLHRLQLACERPIAGAAAQEKSRGVSARGPRLQLGRRAKALQAPEAKAIAEAMKRVEVKRAIDKEARLAFGGDLIALIRDNVFEDASKFHDMLDAALVYGYTSQQLADALRTLPGNISRWKSRQCSPSPRNRNFDMWSLHCFVMQSIGHAPEPYPIETPVLEISAELEERWIAEAMTAERHFEPSTAPKLAKKTKSAKKAPAPKRAKRKRGPRVAKLPAKAKQAKAASTRG